MYLLHGVKCRHVFAGGLSLAVEGPSKAEIVCQDNDDGTCTVTYLPTEPGLYNVVVKFDDEHILGSPFTSYIAGTYQPSPNLPNFFILARITSNFKTTALNISKSWPLT